MVTSVVTRIIPTEVWHPDRSGADLDGNPVVPRRPLRNDAALLGRLQLARPISRANLKVMLSRSGRNPWMAPERPGQLCAGVIDLAWEPGFAIIQADLDRRDTAIATECNTPQVNRGAGLERVFEFGHIEQGTRWNHKTRPPTLFLVEAFDRFVHDFDAGDPLHVLFAEVSRYDQPSGIAMPVRKLLPVDGEGKECIGIERNVDGDGVGVAIDRM